MCIQTCERIIGYRFRTPRYIKEALIPRPSSNQRLALVGDKIADAQLVTRWYDDERQPTPFMWEIVRNRLVSNKNLAEVGVRLRIQDCTLGHCGTGKLLANTMEAIIGAVWLDSKRDIGAVDAVMERLGLTKHALIRSPKTTFTTKPSKLREIQSSLSLPDCFFVGHHLALQQLLFRHSPSFVVQHHTSQHAGLLDHEPARKAAGERQPTGLWPRLRHILYAPPISQEPIPSDTINPPKRQAPARVLATREQGNTEHDDSALDSALSLQQPVAPRDHEGSLVRQLDIAAAWLDRDTEWTRVCHFVRAVREDDQTPADQKELLLGRLRAHRRLLSELPGKSLKNMPNDSPADRIFLKTHSENPEADRWYALQAGGLLRLHSHLGTKRGKGRVRPECREKRELLRNQITAIFRQRLELWIPDTHKMQIPPSLPDSGQTSADSSETPGPGLAVTAAVDSARISASEPCEDRRPPKPGSVLWTSHTAQHKSVDWKQYLSKPTSENRQTT